jgi:membrane protein YdbS with pleckstrin-like domain
MRTKFDFYIHGLWILASIMFMIASMIAGNISYVEGTTPESYLVSIVLSFVLFLVATMLVISASINAMKEQR